ncbi:MAG: hypothetical protein K0R58_1782 [Ramlibacter sp.]|jgi:hypothetical protein|nr:hypothetical protein [Ramlibacter sp.]
MSGTTNIHHLPHVGGIAVQELSWEESGWDTLSGATADFRASEIRFPTLVDWRLCLAGGLAGQLLFHPTFPYGRQHATARILEVRILSDLRRPIAFAEDGSTYRLVSPGEDVRRACREWLDLMLGTGLPLPTLPPGGLAFPEGNGFGGMLPH